MSFAFNASAIPISTASDGDWEVTTINGNLTNNSSLLSSQVWWQDQALAEEFAALVQDALGLPEGGGTSGPYFVFDIGSTSGSGVRWNDTTSQTQTAGLSLIGGFTLAIAAPIPEPSTALLFASWAAAFAIIRRRTRQRIATRLNCVSKVYTPVS